jgi:signal transduction histidine kinase
MPITLFNPLRQHAAEFDMHFLPPRFREEDMEAAYRRTRFDETLVKNRIGLILGIITLGTLMLADALFFPWQEARWLIFSRLAVAWPCFISILVLSYTKHAQKFLKPAIAFSIIWVGFSILSNYFITSTALIQHYYVALIITMLFGFTYIHGNSLHALFTGTVIQLSYLLVCFLLPLPVGIAITSNLFLLAINVIGFSNNYSLEFSTRREFWIQHQLRKERENLRILNNELDLLVTKRTQQLEDSTAFIQQFNTGVANDLKAPLNSAHDYLGLFYQRNQDSFDAVSMELMNEINAHCNRVKSMIDSLVDYARLQETASRLTPLNSNFIVEIAIRRLYSEIRTAEAKIEVGELPTVMGDEGQLIILFTSLLSNAVKYHGDTKPYISIEAKHLGDSGLWQFCVADNGIGIPILGQAHLFQFFSRLHPTEAITGIGMGLAICKRIIEMHGGEIWVESEPNSGSRFYFTLKDVEQ